MLVISKDAVRVKVIHDRAVDYMFEEFTCDACKRLDGNWERENEMEFHPDKCQVLRIINEKKAHPGNL